MGVVNDLALALQRGRVVVRRRITSQVSLIFTDGTPNYVFKSNKVIVLVPDQHTVTQIRHSNLEDLLKSRYLDIIPLDEEEDAPSPEGQAPPKVWRIYERDIIDLRHYGTTDHDTAHDSSYNGDLPIESDAGGNNTLREHLNDPIIHGGGSGSQLIINCSNNTGLFIVAKKAVFLLSDESIALASALNITTSIFFGITLESIPNGDSGNVQFSGRIVDALSGMGMTSGNNVYLSESYGVLTQVIPTIVGSIIFKVGIAKGNDLIIQPQLIAGL